MSERADTVAGRPELVYTAGEGKALKNSDNTRTHTRTQDPFSLVNTNKTSISWSEFLPRTTPEANNGGISIEHKIKYCRTVSYAGT